MHASAALVMSRRRHATMVSRAVLVILRHRHLRRRAIRMAREAKAVRAVAVKVVDRVAVVAAKPASAGR